MTIKQFNVRRVAVMPANPEPNTIYFVKPDGAATFTSSVTNNSGTPYAYAAETEFVRERLSANRTYYVRTDGSDLNDGLSDTSAGAFATISKAMAVCGLLECAQFNVTVNVRAGTYAEVAYLPQMLGSGTFSLVGSGTDCLILGIETRPYSKWAVGGFKFNGTAINQIYCTNHSFLTVSSAVEFTTTSASHVYCIISAQCKFDANYTISGGALFHWRADEPSATVFAFGRSVTLTGTPSFGWAFAYFGFLSAGITGSMTFTGAATGRRFQVFGGSYLQSDGTDDYFPGDLIGTEN